MKISPDLYGKILNSLKLSNLYLVQLHADFLENNMEERQEMILDTVFKERVSHEVKNDLLHIFYTFTLHIINKDNKQPVIKIKIKYHIVYEILAENIQIPKEFIQVFKQITLGMLLWPYFRQTVNDVISKMNLPPFILPMRRLTVE